MNIGENVPDFELLDSEGSEWRLSEQRGKVVVLIFYPKDNTPVCTAQMCSMRDRWRDYELSGAEVVAISVGSVQSHREFAQKHRLPQRLLADENANVSRLLGVKSAWGGSQRAVVIVDAAGALRYRKSTFVFLRPGDDCVLAAIRASVAAA